MAANGSLQEFRRFYDTVKYYSPLFNTYKTYNNSWQLIALDGISSYTLKSLWKHSWKIPKQKSRRTCRTPFQISPWNYLTPLFKTAILYLSDRMVGNSYKDLISRNALANSLQESLSYIEIVNKYILLWWCIFIKFFGFTFFQKLSWTCQHCVLLVDPPKWHVGCWHAGTLRKCWECWVSTLSNSVSQTMTNTMACHTSKASTNMLENIYALQKIKL